MTDDEKEIIASLEKRLDRHELDDNRRNDEIMRVIDDIKQEQKAAIDRDHCKDLESAEMKRDIKTISDYIAAIDPKKKARTQVVLIVVGLLFAGIQSATAIIVLAIARDLPK